MIQEIITYLLIGSAVTLAVLKTIKKFSKKKKPKIDFKNETFKMEHNCSACAADCMLRNASLESKKENEKVCRELHIKSN